MTGPRGPGRSQDTAFWEISPGPVWPGSDFQAAGALMRDCRAGAQNATAGRDLSAAHHPDGPRTHRDQRSARLRLGIAAWARLLRLSDSNRKRPATRRTPAPLAAHHERQLLFEYLRGYGNPFVVGTYLKHPLVDLGQVLVVTRR
jgi:hypothetical protein